MSAEDLNMDNSFRKAAGELKFSYNKSFWNDAEKHLDDSSMDAAFQNAAAVSSFMPDLNIADTISDAFMDEAFKSAAQSVHVDFSAANWSQFSNERSEIEQNVSFTDAANSVTADYHPVFWTDADQALQNEGLHYEYKTSYWNDARVLLDKSDRGVFFRRWSAVAAILLLFSIGGVYSTLNSESDGNSNNSNSSAVQQNNSGLNSSENASTNNTGKNDVLVDADNNQIQNADENNLVSNNAIEIATDDTQNDLMNNQNDIENSQVISSSDLSSENNSSSESLSNQNIENNNLNEENPVVENTGENNVSNNQELNQQTDLSAGQSTNNLNEEHILDSSSDPLNRSTENSLNEEMNSELNESIVKLPGAVSGFDAAAITEYAGPEIEITKFRLKPTHTVSFYGNAGVGNKYNAAEFTPTFRTNFGLEYRRSGFGKMRNFEFGAAAGFNHVRQRDFGTERRVSVFTLDGGTDKLWYKLQLKDMIYANVSGLVSYNISSKHKLSFTAGADYLVFVQSNMSYKVDSDEGIKTVNNNWGVKDGLNKIDLRIGVGYEFALTKNIALRANGSFGFFDRSENNF
ncbi:MAG: hypothetical protein JNJ99_01610, partial [Crocinitomicaceae bacterium]|nr:hypothetical protein [Crocinitomicaceae bacterium]